MIAVDTNILIYARRSETPHHIRALRLLTELAQGDRPWALPWPCIYEFLRVVTHPRVFDPPTDIEAALEGISSLLESPSIVLLGEGPGHLERMRQSILSGHATGNLVYDAHIAALCLEHGVRELLTADRDMTRFAGMRIRNPFSGTR